jgi:hypothetical protein
MIYLTWNKFLSELTFLAIVGSSLDKLNIYVIKSLINLVKLKILDKPI